MTKTQPHVAVVDDEEPIRKALMRLMRSAGLSVETFASGPEFLESLDTRLPDCVVLDLHMPHMNGFNVQAHLAQKHAALPVIIFTGHDFPNARERAMQGGASAFLRKPVLDRTLLGAISAATSSAQPGGSPNGHGVFSELRSPIPGERESEGWKHQSKSQFPRATAPAAARTTNTNVLDRHGNGRPRTTKKRRKNKSETPK